MRNLFATPPPGPLAVSETSTLRSTEKMFLISRRAKKADDYNDDAENSLEMPVQGDRQRRRLNSGQNHALNTRVGTQTELSFDAQHHDLPTIPLEHPNPSMTAAVSMVGEQIGSDFQFG
jgi:hypothetical protein